MRSRLVTVGKVLSCAVATLVVSLTLPVAPAAAHGQLATSTPLTGTVVREPLTQLALYFTEKPAANAHFAVTGPDGSRVDNGWSFGEPRRLDQPVTEYFLVNGVFEPRLYHTGIPAMVSVAHWPAKGRYTASYLSVASDGEAVRGSVTFDYQGRGTARRPVGRRPRRGRSRPCSPWPRGTGRRPRRRPAARSRRPALRRMIRPAPAGSGPTAVFRPGCCRRCSSSWSPRSCWWRPAVGPRRAVPAPRTVAGGSAPHPAFFAYRLELSHEHRELLMHRGEAMDSGIETP
ncbi:copper resistance CopC family protein [Micromonospora tarensis]|uniref:Copper resistance protein CopC n=1 Tax=Micromonospora tarensis TaxID=2806100 RepID=A0ABS1YIK3_9ACTN|nr:copper resistance protein CopC [Micromonospora tarensis]MBM0277208.1 copper resistance protein CopC [Micromonospora tarensis]